jgi:DNA-binding response OmpR family regulator
MVTQPKPAPVILLVDDEEGIRNLLRVALQREGYGVLEADNGSEAFALFDKYKREIALFPTDVVMPEIGGFELARQVVTKRPEVPIAFISAFCGTIPNDLNRYHYIPKPFLSDEIIGRVAEIVPRPD